MPKNEIDYSNTIIYKICCKDSNINDVYVGHTTNFTKRKSLHKSSCNNLNNSYKIYKIIRENGGWENWDMIELAKYNCKDHTEARIKEQEYYDLLKCNLNSCPPFYNKPYIFCEKCNYKCSKQSEFNKHILTNKHKNLQNPTSYSEIPKTYTCVCGKIYKHTSTLYAHKKICNYLKVNNNCTDKQINNTEELIKYLMKENSEFKNLLIDQNKKLLELTKEVFINKNL
jgi:hypothetical protein